MPLYQYGCRSCGRRFEEMRKLAERFQAVPCPACGAQQTTLMMSAPARVGGSSGSQEPISLGRAGGGCGPGCCGGACMH